MSYQDDSKYGDRYRYAIQVAAALEEVESWMKAGVIVNDRQWADAGGGNGYYSVALRLAGAKNVTLLDSSQPCQSARPDLATAEVTVLIGDGGKVCMPQVDALALLYVPELEISDVFHLYPALTQVIVDNGHEENSDDWTHDVPF